MNTPGFSPLAVTLLAAALIAGHASAAERVDLLIRDATVVDVVSGKLQPHRTIAVRDGHILAVADAKQAKKYDAPQVVDARGKFAIPGLWDMHVHFG